MKIKITEVSPKEIRAYDMKIGQVGVVVGESYNMNIGQVKL